MELDGPHVVVIFSLGPPWAFWVFVAIVVSLIVITICVVTIRACKSCCSDEERPNMRTGNTRLRNMNLRNGKTRRRGDAESGLGLSPNIWDTSSPDNYTCDDAMLLTVGKHIVVGHIMLLECIIVKDIMTEEHTMLDMIAADMGMKREVVTVAMVILVVVTAVAVVTVAGEVIAEVDVTAGEEWIKTI